MGTSVSGSLVDINAFRPPPGEYPPAASAAAAGNPSLPTTATAVQPSAAAIEAGSAPAASGTQEHADHSPRKSGEGRGSSVDSSSSPLLLVPQPANTPAPAECSTTHGKGPRAGSAMGGGTTRREENSLRNQVAWQEVHVGGFGAAEHPGVAEPVADALTVAADPEAGARQDAIDDAGHVSLTVGVNTVTGAAQLGDTIRPPLAAAPEAPSFEVFSETSVLLGEGSGAAVEPRAKPVVGLGSASGALGKPTTMSMVTAGMWDTMVHSLVTPAAAAATATATTATAATATATATAATTTAVAPALLILAPAATAAFRAPSVEPLLAHTPTAMDAAATPRSVSLPLPATSLAGGIVAPPPTLLSSFSGGSTPSLSIFSNGSGGDGSGSNGGISSLPLVAGASQVVGAVQGETAQAGCHFFPSFDLAGQIAPPPDPPSLPIVSPRLVAAKSAAVTTTSKPPPRGENDFLRQMQWTSTAPTFWGPSSSSSSSATVERPEGAPNTTGVVRPPQASIAAVAAAAATSSVAALLEQHQLHHDNPLPTPGDIDVGLEHHPPRAETKNHPSPPVPAVGPPSTTVSMNRTTPDDDARPKRADTATGSGEEPPPPPLPHPDDIVPNPSQQPATSISVVGGSDTGGGGKRRQRRRTCEEEHCGRRPVFGPEGTSATRFCASHKPDGFVNVNCRRCEIEGCNRQPSFGMMPTPPVTTPHQQPPLRLGGTTDKNSSNPGVTAASTCATALPRATVASRCASHRTEGMINLSAPKCTARTPPGFCPVVASFGRPGARRPTACSAHRRDGDVDVVTRRCRKKGCVHRPVFGYLPRQQQQQQQQQPGGGQEEEEEEEEEEKEVRRKKARYCNAHKLDGMVNIFAARCIAQKSCRDLATFGPPGVKKPTHCAKHRVEQQERITTYHS